MIASILACTYCEGFQEGTAFPILKLKAVRINSSALLSHC